MYTAGGRSSRRLATRGIAKRPVGSDSNFLTKRNKTGGREEVDGSNNTPATVLAQPTTSTVNAKSHLAIFTQRVRSLSELSVSSDDDSEWDANSQVTIMLGLSCVSEKHGRQ